MLTLSKSVIEALDDFELKNGMVEASQCQQICKEHSISTEKLMIALLSIAQQYAKAVVSDFQVGAIAKGKKVNDSGYANLYFAANIEFENRSLCHSIHAEQAVISIAWQHGEKGISSIATSAAPCGHCRQFIYELSHNQAFSILTPTNQTIEDLSYQSRDISELLPDAFGPRDLDRNQKFMQDFNKLESFVLNDSISTDLLINEAFAEAARSYAPYSENYAGCAIQTNDGIIFSGKSIENAAFNPSLPAFSAALVSLVMGQPKNQQIGSIFDRVKRVVLVEYATLANQQDLSRSLLATCSKSLEMQSYQMLLAENI